MYCPHCQYKNDKGATVCARCGKSLSEEVPAAKVPESKQTKGLSTGALIGIIAAVVVVLAAIIVVVMLVLPSSDPVNVDPPANTNVQNVTTGNSNSKENVTDNTSSTASNEAVNEVVESKSSTKNAVDFLTTSTDGTVLSGKIRRDANDYVIAKSSVTAYSTSQLSSMGLTDAELCIAWWEPYAAKGAHFTNSALSKYFSGCSWYKDKGYSYTDIQLDSPALTNISRLKSLVSKSSPWLSLSES